MKLHLVKKRVFFYISIKVKPQTKCTMEYSGGYWQPRECPLYLSIAILRLPPEGGRYSYYNGAFLFNKVFYHHDYMTMFLFFYIYFGTFFSKSHDFFTNLFEFYCVTFIISIKVSLDF